jgi:hypothetical protein
MLAIVAVQAQEFPVAAVGRIVVVVAIFVVHRQLVQFLAGKFPAAPGADPRQDFERLIAINIPRRSRSCRASARMCSSSPSFDRFVFEDIVNPNLASLNRAIRNSNCFRLEF